MTVVEGHLRGGHRARARAALAGAALAAAAGAGCVVVDAPESMEELVTFSFAHYDDGPLWLEAAGANLFPQVEARYEELLGGYRVDTLGASELHAAGLEADEDLEIIGALGTASYRHDLPDLLSVLTMPDKADAVANLLEYEIYAEADRDCFLARTCPTYWVDYREVTTVPLLGQATNRARRAYTWVEPDEGLPYVVLRTLSPEPVDFSTNLVAVDQRYDLVFLQDLPEGARRVEALWVEARFLEGEIPDYLAIQTAVNGMQNAADALDAYLDEVGGAVP